MVVYYFPRFIMLYFVLVKIIFVCQEYEHKDQILNGKSISLEQNDSYIEQGLSRWIKKFLIGYSYLDRYNNLLQQPVRPSKSWRSSNNLLKPYLRRDKAIRLKRNLNGDADERKFPRENGEDREESEPANFFFKNFTESWRNSAEKSKEISNFDKDKNSDMDLDQYLAVQSSYYTIPRKTVELLQSNEMCPRKENDVRPCGTVFIKNQRIGRVWPRELLTASCKCNGQRCNIRGIDTCTTIISRVTVISHRGTRSKDIIPVACVCMALRGIPAKEMIPDIYGLPITEHQDCFSSEGIYKFHK